jgi:hypothetical protein
MIVSPLAGLLAKLGVLQRPYKPYIPASVDQTALMNQIAKFFHQPRKEVQSRYHTYRAFHEARNYAATFGERKTLCFEEAFILYNILANTRPQSIVEIGTQYGRSTRRIIDIKNLLKLDSSIVCFDVADEVQHFGRGEAQLVLKDVTHSFHQDVLQTHGPSLIYLDAHPHGLLKHVISETMTAAPHCMLAIHDCSPYLCNPRMTRSKDDLHITSVTGHWERYVLAEIFKVSNPLSKHLDNCQTATHRLRIFGTPHGLAVIGRKR